MRRYGTWFVDSSAWNTGSIVLEQRLREALELLSRMGIRVPESGRHRKAISLLHQWNNSDTEIDLTDKEMLLRFEAAHRTAWETFLITVAAEKHRKKWKNREDLFTSERLSTMLRGPEIRDNSDTSARDAQFELHIGAEFQLASMEVQGGEPDLRFQYGQEWVGVAAKRVSSLAPKQLQKHLNKAVEQIEKSGLRGWVAVNIDTRFQGVELGMPMEELLAEFGRLFDQVHQALEPHWNNPAVLGVLEYGYATTWSAPQKPGDPPGLQFAQPFRWYRWSEDEDAKRLHDAFTAGYEGRLRARRQILASPDFNGLL